MSSTTELDVFYYRNWSNSADSDDEDGEGEAKEDEMMTKTETTKDVSLETICEELNTKWEEISRKTSKIVHKTHIAIGVWDEVTRMVRIESNKHLKHYVPERRGGDFWLRPFEALFAMENRMLMIKYRGVDLSLEDATNLLLEDEKQLVPYRIFSILSRCGYYVHQLDDDKAEVTEPMVIDAVAEDDISQHKRSHESVEDGGDDVEDVDQKKIDAKPQQYPVVTNIRPLRVEHLRNLTRVDHQLIANSECKQQASFLYTVRQADQFVPVHRRLQPLYGGNVKPLLPLGSTITIDKLCQLVQSVGPMDRKCSTKNTITTPLVLHFSIFYSIQQFKQCPASPLYYVTIVNSDESLPSLEQIELHDQHHRSPVLFALVSRTFIYNFYTFKQLMLDDQLPDLWRRLCEGDNNKNA